MDEKKAREVLRDIEKTGVIILEHQSSKAFKNDIITIGAKSIVAMAKDLLDEIEKQRR